MPADIVHRPDFTVGTSGNNDRIFTDFDQLIITTVWDLAAVESVQPAPENEMPQLLLVNQMRAIEIRVNSVVRPGLLGLELRTHPIKGIVN